jgi:hypothetical protein
MSKGIRRILVIGLGVQIIVIALYVGLVVKPFYANGLNMQPREKVAGGSYEPAGLPTFCFLPSGLPDWIPGRCADGTDGDPSGEWLLGGAMLLALFGPVVLGILGVSAGIALAAEWSRLHSPARAIALANIVVSLGAVGFMWGTPMGRLLFTWIMD